MSSPKNKEQKQLYADRPLCVFRFSCNGQKQGYHESTQRRQRSQRSTSTQKGVKSWGRKRRRQLAKKPLNLTGYLLSKDQNESTMNNDLLPISKVLDEVQKTWDSNGSNEGSTVFPSAPKRPPTKEDSQLKRRRSVPEEVMRKYAVTNENDDSEHIAATECTSSSSRERQPIVTLKKQRNVEMEDRRFISTTTQSSIDPIKAKGLSKREMLKADVFSYRVKSEESSNQSYIMAEKSSSSDSMERLPKMNTIKRSPFRRYSIVETDILNETEIFKSPTDSTQPIESSSSNVNSPKSDSLSSPTICARPLTSSEHRSTDSEGCNCIELTSYITSTSDPYHSGKSTLSQSKSVKTSSTQDSTVSVKSVSSRGTTATAESGENSSNDNGINSVKDIKNYYADKGKFDDFDESRSQVPSSNKYKSIGTITDVRSGELVETGVGTSDYWKGHTSICNHVTLPSNSFHSVDESLNSHTVSSAIASKKSDDSDFMVPRYTALPKTLSMVVNFTSQDMSTHSDSESLTDSLEDEYRPLLHERYDTKHEKKPVRGAALSPKVRQKSQPQGKAYFLSIDEKGENEFISNIYKIPEPPQKIKQSIFQRHTNICKVRKIRERLKTNGQQQIKVKTKLKHNPSKLKNRRMLNSCKETVDASVETDSTESQLFLNQGSARQSEQQCTSSESISDLCRNEDSKETIEASKVENHEKNELISKPFEEEIVTKSSAPAATKKFSSKFHQKFEVIPEERSSSLTSSTEDPLSERNRRFSMPEKLPEDNTVIVSNEGKTFRRYSLGSLPKSMLTQFVGNSLETISCIQKGTDTTTKEMIIFSPKVTNSTKGRDALLAISKEDFYRKSKGWMNFYLLKENSEQNSPRDSNRARQQTEEISEDFQTEIKVTSNTGEGTKSLEEVLKQSMKLDTQIPLAKTLKLKKKKNPIIKEVIKPMPEESLLRFHTSNTLLKQPRNSTFSKTTARSPSSSQTSPMSPKQLDDFHPSKSSGKEKTSGLSRLRKEESDCATQRIELRKEIEKLSIRSDSGESQSDSTAYFQPPSPKVPRLPIDECNSLSDCTWSSSEEDEPTKRQPFQFPPPRRRPFIRIRNNQATDLKRKRWSVTVEGILEFPRKTPDVQMKLSFPLDHGPPIISQSDSGFVDDHLKRSLKPQKNRRVTIENPTSDAYSCKSSLNKTTLPTLTTTRSIGRNSDKSFKLESWQHVLKLPEEQKLKRILPQLQNLLSSIVPEEISDVMESDEEPLSVRGKAVTLKKERDVTATKMSQRDLTKRNSQRNSNRL